MRWHEDYGTTEGPLGIPCTQGQARFLDEVMKALPADDREPLFTIVDRSLTELTPAGRSDISWITTEDVDRHNEIVITAGIHDEYYAMNPVVSMNHKYDLPCVGRSLWRKPTVEGKRKGVKAKTYYPRRGADLPASEPWPPDTAWAMVSEGVLNGKSIGFLPIKERIPTDEEVRRTPGLGKVRRIIEECMLLEYSCCALPVNSYSVIERVEKSFPIPRHVWEALGIDLDQFEAERNLARFYAHFKGDYQPPIADDLVRAPAPDLLRPDDREMTAQEQCARVEEWFRQNAWQFEQTLGPILLKTAEILMQMAFQKFLLEKWPIKVEQFLQSRHQSYLRN